MQCYKIRESLVPVTAEELRQADAPFVAVVNEREWQEQNSLFGMRLDFELNLSDALDTEAVVNYDSLTGSFCIPDRAHICGEGHRFCFALDDRGIVFIDRGDYVEGLVEKVRISRKWRKPCLERFLYDFLEETIDGDLRLLEGMEHQLNAEEERIQNGTTEIYSREINDMRGELLDLRMHYDQLIDVAYELVENENGFFAPENIHYFRMLTGRLTRLEYRVDALREYTAQIRDLVDSQLEEKQNRVMSLLTIVATIFMPLTLIAGWYGMNFVYMPELQWKWAYPTVIVVSVAIVLGCVAYFKKKKLF